MFLKTKQAHEMRLILRNSGDGFLDKNFSNYVDASSYILGTSKNQKNSFN